MFEIGVVYHRPGYPGLFLATDAKTLFRFVRGRPTAIRPRAHQDWKTIFAVPFEVLCDRWGVTLETADLELAARIERPVASTRNPRGSGSSQSRRSTPSKLPVLRLGSRVA